MIHEQEATATQREYADLFEIDANLDRLVKKI